MNFIQMMHYTQYHFLIEKRDFGDLSNLAAKGTISGLLGASLILFQDLIGIKINSFLHNYWQVALFIALPFFLLVNYFALSDKELKDENNEIYRAKGKMYLDIFTYCPLIYAVYLCTKYTLYGT